MKHRLAIPRRGRDDWLTAFNDAVIDPDFDDFDETLGLNDAGGVYCNTLGEAASPRAKIWHPPVASAGRGRYMTAEQEREIEASWVRGRERRDLLIVAPRSPAVFDWELLRRNHDAALREAAEREAIRAREDAEVFRKEQAAKLVILRAQLQEERARRRGYGG